MNDDFGKFSYKTKLIENFAIIRRFRTNPVKLDLTSILALCIICYKREFHLFACQTHVFSRMFTSV